MTRSRATRCDLCRKPTRRSKMVSVETDCGEAQICPRCLHEFYPAVEAELKEKT